jgi:hypothetical protein
MYLPLPSDTQNVVVALGMLRVTVPLLLVVPCATTLFDCHAWTTALATGVLFGPITVTETDTVLAITAPATIIATINAATMDLNSTSFINQINTSLFINFVSANKHV